MSYKAPRRQKIASSVGGRPDVLAERGVQGGSGALRWSGLWSAVPGHVVLGWQGGGDGGLLRAPVPHGFCAGGQEEAGQGGGGGAANGSVTSSLRCWMRRESGGPSVLHSRVQALTCEVACSFPSPGEEEEEEEEEESAPEVFLLQFLCSVCVSLEEHASVGLLWKTASRVQQWIHVALWDDFHTSSP